MRVDELSTQVLRLDGSDVAALAADPGVVAITAWSAPQLRDERSAQIVAGNLTGAGAPDPDPSLDYPVWLEDQGFAELDLRLRDRRDRLRARQRGRSAGPPRLLCGRRQTRSRPGGVHRGLHAGHRREPAQGLRGPRHQRGLDRRRLRRLDAGRRAGVQVRDRRRPARADRRLQGVRLQLQVLQQRDLPGHRRGGVRLRPPEGPDLEQLLGRSPGGRLLRPEAQIYDSIVRDASPDRTGNQEMVEVFAAGNDGVDVRLRLDRLSGDREERDHRRARRRVSGRLREGSTAAASATPRQTTPATSSGSPVADPPVDGRLKPDLVAPGQPHRRRRAPARRLQRQLRLQRALSRGEPLPLPVLRHLPGRAARVGSGRADPRVVRPAPRSAAPLPRPR